MTTIAMTNQTATTSGRSLEELVDRLMDAVLGKTSGQSDRPAQSVARSIHDARRLRRSGDPDGALAVLGGVDMAEATERDSRWAYAEWTGMARRRYSGEEAMVYSQGTGRGAVLLPRSDGMLEVAAAIGMRWQPGRLVSRRSVRGVRPVKGADR